MHIGDLWRQPVLIVLGDMVVIEIGEELLDVLDFRFRDEDRTVHFPHIRVFVSY